MTLSLYRLLTRLLFPFIALYVLWRLQKGKEDAVRLKERFGYTHLPRPQGKLIWVHAASVGESISVLPLITRIVESHKDRHVLLTTGTVTSARLVADKLPKNTVHQYIPVDQYAAVRRFVAHWQPDLALWTESELWPNLVTEAAKCCPVLMINGRLSEKSLTFWQRFPHVKQAIMASFSLCLVQSRGDGERVMRMGAPKVEYLGNLKYDAPSLPAKAALLEPLKESVGKRIIWAAASTHEGEEEQIADVHEQLKVLYPDLLTVLIPRHPHRGESIREGLQKRGMTVATRSKGDAITEGTEIYLADTMGELGLFFRIAKVVFIGASLIARGGHNPLEPARLGCAVIMGPSSYNFIEIVEDMQAKGALITVADKQALALLLTSLLADTKKQALFGGKALTVVKEAGAVTERYLEVIEGFIGGRG